MHVNSVEKHFQSNKAAPGTGLAQLPGVDELLIKLSRVAQHPPRDSHYTYWLWNSGETPLTFTGDKQEIFFNVAVNRTDQLHTACGDALRPICQGDVSILSPSGTEGLRFAEHNMSELRKLYLSFMTRDSFSDQRNMEPLFFMLRFRTYLPTYPIKGITWEGVNAANLASQMRADYLIGTVDPDYARTVRRRFRFLTEEDKRGLETDMSLPSIVDLLLDHIARLC